MQEPTLPALPPTGLTRSNLHSGQYLRDLRVPDGRRWSEEAIEGSLRQALAARPPGALWVFAYGSLMWNPLLEFDACEAATLAGWHRSFCLRVEAGRGTPERPGRMLALEPGGSAQGLALRLHDDGVAAELRMLWMREMVTGAYRPAWLPVTLHDGRSVQAVTFLAEPAGLGYECDASVQTVTAIVAAATGVFGSNADYVRHLAQTLARHGLRDDYIAELAQSLDEAGTATPG